MIIKPKVGISSCLLGNPVRYDGGHKRDAFLVDTFGQFVQWVPVCPEVECGLPVPRPSMRLMGNPDRPRLLTQKGEDFTARVLSWAQKKLRELEKEELCGFVFKKNSPSSGMERVRVYDPKGMSQRVGSGLFAKAFMDRFPLLPVEEEGRLQDPDHRENFIERIFCLMRFRQQLKSSPSAHRLLQFHSNHKYQLMAHSPEKLSIMGRWVASVKERPLSATIGQYESLLLEAIKIRATPAKNFNVLQHMLGYFKKVILADEKQEMLTSFTQYKQGLIPLVVPITLLSHLVRKTKHPLLMGQTYLNPHPMELKLRNHA